MEQKKSKEVLISKLKKFFINNSKFKIEKKDFFSSKRKLINKKTNEKVYLNPYSITFKFYRDYVFYKSYCNYLYDISKKKGLQPYLLTLTQPYNLENMNVSESITYLKKIVRTYRLALREIIREFQRERDIYFISVIEFNNELFFHLHVIVFIHPIFTNKFFEIIKNKIKLFELGEKFNFEKVYNYDNSCEYLLKSIKTASKNEKFAYLLDGTINVLKYKLVTHSKTKINKKIFFKLYPFVKKKITIKTNKNGNSDKYLNIYKYIIKKTNIKTFEKMPSKKRIKKFLSNIKKHIHKIYIFQEKEEIEKPHEFVELQNKLLIKKILALNNINKYSKDLLEEVSKYINQYISSLESIFSYTTLRKFRLRFNSLKDLLLRKKFGKFVNSLKNILLYRSIKYIYTRRTLIYLRRKKSWKLVYDSNDYEWVIIKQ